MERNNWSRHTFRSINWDVPGKALDILENSARIFIVKFALCHHLPTHRHMHRTKQHCKRQMPSLHPSYRNRLASSKLPQLVTLAQRATWNPRGDSDHPSHSTRLSSHLAPRNLGSPCQPSLILSDESQQSRTHLQSSCQFQEQKRMATSSQWPLQQSLDSDSGTTHSRRPRNRLRETV